MKGQSSARHPISTETLPSIAHITSLKHQLKELYAEDNGRINDDCIPSLCLFSSLVLLRVYGTGIKMQGLRRLASSVHNEGREIDVEIPEECERYLNSHSRRVASSMSLSLDFRTGLHSQYQMHPIAPLITDPCACRSLSANALKMNLAAHAVFNPSIYLSGSKLELIDRLREILETRLADRVVKEIVWGYESSGVVSDVESDSLETADKQ